MANVISMGANFPPELVTEMFNTVRGKSSLARLGGQIPVAFRGSQLMTFSLDKEVDLVAENGAKSNGGATIAPVNAIPVKIEYGTRVSDEFVKAADEVRLQYLRAFAEGFAAKAARGLDIMAMHALNPRSATAATQLANKDFDSLVTQTVTASADGNANVEAAVALVTGSEHDVSGIAIAPAFRSVLAAQTTQAGAPLFPELAWGSNPGTIRGLDADVNSTVSFNQNADRAIVGNFRDFFKWGYADEVNVEVIQYGNPDNDAEAGDLKGHNQVYLRGEAYVGWAILDPTAFARIIAGA